MQVAVEVAHLISLAGVQLAVDLLCDAVALGMGERCRALVDDLLPAASDHLAERVVDCEDPVLTVDEDHAGHVVLEREAEALFATRECLGASELGGDHTQLGLGGDLLCWYLGPVIANCHDAPRLAVECERRSGDVDCHLAAVVAQERIAHFAGHLRSRGRVVG